MKFIIVSITVTLMQSSGLSQNKCNELNTQSEMNACALSKYKEADVELNKSYKIILTLIEPERKAQLIATQKKWIEYKEAHCHFYEVQFEGGSMMPLMHYSCLESITRDRIREIKEIVSLLEF